MSAKPPPSKPLEKLEVKQARATLWKTRLEALQILFIFLIGAVAVALFYLWQANEAHNHYYADLQAEREKADSALRAEMFKTLVGAYFRQAGEPTPGAAPDAKQRAPTEAASLAQVERDIMLSDLLSRNFDTVDVRPLFEDLDRRLSPRPTGGAVDREKDRKRLELRERLRRVAAGATSRQRVQLNFPVTYATVMHCPGNVVTVDVFGEGESVAADDEASKALIRRVSKDHPALAFRVLGVRDAEVFLEVFGGENPSPPQFTVSYYDMPLLEQVRLPTKEKERVAFSVTRYVSTEICMSEGLKKSMNLNAKRDVDDLCKDLAADCERARLAITTFPEDFIAARERPFLSDLTQKQKSLPDWESIKDWFRSWFRRNESAAPASSTTPPR